MIIIYNIFLLYRNIFFNILYILMIILNIITNLDKYGIFPLLAEQR